LQNSLSGKTRPLGENIMGVWTERANKVLRLMEKLPVTKEGSPEKEFQRAVWSLCQQIKDGEPGNDDGQFIAPSIMGG
jgi:hypothetical protein